MSSHAKDHICLFITSIGLCGLVSYGQPGLAVQKKKKKERESLDLDIYTQCSDSKAANLANSCQKLTRNLFTAYKHSSTGDSPYDLGESCNLYVWGSSDVNYRDVLNIMNERHNGIVQQYQTNYFILPEFICFI